ncbi:MAG: TorF family putative porin [Oceanococcaceae bacterium]
MNRMIAALALVTPCVAWASSEINLGISSEYVFRGIPQSDGAQVWASLDVAQESWGTYLGLWVSNAGRAGNEEVDVYAGYAARIGPRLSLDVGAIGYFDPSAPETGEADNFGEAYVGVNWRRLNGYAYYGFGSTLQDDDEYIYTELNTELDVLADARLRLHVGGFFGMGDFYDLFTEQDYIDYGASFIKDYGLAGQIALAITATSINATHGFTAINPDFESHRPQFTVGWSRSFGSAF